MITPVEDKNFRIIFQTSTNHEATISFYTLRQARNWLRERGAHNVIRFTDLRTSTELTF